MAGVMMIVTPAPTDDAACSIMAGSVKQNARGAVVVPFGFAVM
jgi:hypothetical protein